MLDVGLEGLEILHISQVLSGSDLNLSVPRPIRVAYHDPCSLGRGSGVYEDPRKVIESIEGVELLKAPPEGEASICCGGGGGIWALDNASASAQAGSRLEADFLPLGIQALTTCCPVCHLNFRQVLRRDRSKIKVYDLAELAAISLGRGENEVHGH
jgi:Fe-S oxidoreductase